MFQSCSAFTAFWFHWEETQTLKLDDETESLRSKVPSLEGCFSNEFVELLESEDESFKRISSGTLYDTSKVFEEKYLELLKHEEVTSGTTKNWAIGPFNPVTVSDHGVEWIKLFNWLDKQEPDSVVYVSFGTTVTFTDEEVKEIETGLEESGHKFIWVVREADKADIFDGDDERRVELPEGYGEGGERWGGGGDERLGASA
ncbi:hypothetical protein L1987_77499 [Smallanthus sonchifolius]|uniref:Uncharacterized protein n=1 Tax=Smallanthus sonchifolius TaxID=185202 RepID=A0ACB8Z9R6_9ASTR|nr:hypothetical protein L1987_77499 [Smallanthus sonchifolius]